MMKLPIPIFYKENKYIEYDVKRMLVPGLRAVTRDAENAGTFAGQKTALIEGLKCIIDSNGNEITNKDQIGAIARKASYQSVEAMIKDIFLLLEPDNWITQFLKCPYCARERKINKDDEYYYRDLEVKYIEDDDFTGTFSIELIYPIEIKDNLTNNSIVDIASIQMRYPTLDDCNNALKDFPGQNKEADQTVKAYELAITDINNESRDLKFLKNYRHLLFEKMDRDDFMQISEKMVKYGINKRLQIKCLGCGEELKPVVNMSNFFDYGLRQK